MRLARLAMVALAVATAGCGAISFDVDQAVPEQQVNGSPLGALLGSFLPQPFAININVKQETEKRSTGPATSANVKQIAFRATPHDAPRGNFDFVDEIHIFVAAPAGSTLPMVEIARLAPVPKGLTTLQLDIVPGVDLLPYINAGATISATATGRQPAQTITYDGSVTVTIRI
ncbi:MAG: hypothetical protein JWN44_5190 [Myxococcales bacterium]|nr:hypothetical protein [Myxococcales bacterium]